MKPKKFIRTFNKLLLLQTNPRIETVEVTPDLKRTSPSFKPLIQFIPEATPIVYKRASPTP